PRTASWEFSLTSPEGRGERLFRDPAVGGEQNALACASCHAWRDERTGILRPAGGDSTQLADLSAYLKRISPDAAPPLDYRPMLLGRKTGIDRPTGGDPKRGAVLTERFCGRCHGEGAMRPPLEIGLYEADYLVS